MSARGVEGCVDGHVAQEVLADCLATNLHDGAIGIEELPLELLEGDLDFSFRQLVALFCPRKELDVRCLWTIAVPVRGGEAYPVGNHLLDCPP